MTTPLQRAQRVEELAEKATPGPWSEHSLSVLIGDNLRSEDSDCQFCAETRTLSPALAADVVALTADLEAARSCLIAEGMRVNELEAFLRDAFPMFSHVPLLADRAAALGLAERKEQEP